MERLGVSYSLLYPLQMILHLYMYKQFYMLTVDLCACLTFYCTVVYSSFQPKRACLALFSLKSTWDDKFFSSYLKRLEEKAAFDEPLALSGHYR